MLIPLKVRLSHPDVHQPSCARSARSRSRQAGVHSTKGWSMKLSFEHPRPNYRLTALVLAASFALVLSKPWTQSVHAWGFSFTTESAVRVMTVANDAVAYDFSATVLDPSWGYTALFHAEPYDKSSADCGGDSIGTKVSSYTNPVQPDAFGTHTYENDLLVTRSMDSGQVF